jgi:hypothetical protein
MNLATSVSFKSGCNVQSRLFKRRNVADTIVKCRQNQVIVTLSCSLIFKHLESDTLNSFGRCNPLKSLAMGEQEFEQVQGSREMRRR